MAVVESIADVLDRMRGPPTTVTTYGPERDAAFHAFLGQFDLELRHEDLPIPASSGYLTVRRGGEYRGSVPAAAFDDCLDPPRGPPWGPETRESGYRNLSALLDGSVFTSVERPHLLATAREIEDRAWRVGRGTLYAGFQSLSAYRNQLRVYRRLVAETDLAVHVYGDADWTPPALPGISVHTDAGDGDAGDGAAGNGNASADAAGELGAFWFVVFDGGGDDRMACALVAEEVDDGAYRGAWTYDPAVVRAFAAYLDATYGPGDTAASSDPDDLGHARDPGDAGESSESGESGESGGPAGSGDAGEHNG